MHTKPNRSKLIAAVLVMSLVIIGFGLVDRAKAQDPTPKPAGETLAEAEFDLVSEWTVDGSKITQVAAAPDGSLICTVTDDTLLACVDQAGMTTFTYDSPDRIIGILVALNGDVYTVQQNIYDASSPYIALSRVVMSGGTTMLTAQIDGVYVEEVSSGIFNDGALLMRMDPRTQTLLLARAGGSQVAQFDLSLFDNPSNDYEPEPLRSWVIDFNVRDLAIDADGSLIALSEEGQVFRAQPGAAFVPLTGDYNGDGAIDTADYFIDGILFGGSGPDPVFVAGRRTNPATGAAMLSVMQLGNDGLAPFSSWNFENGWPSKATMTGIVMADGSVVFALGADIFQIDPAGTTRRLPLVGDDVGALIGDEIGILLLKNPSRSEPSLLWIDASSPLLQIFNLQR